MLTMRIPSRILEVSRQIAGLSILVLCIGNANSLGDWNGGYGHLVALGFFLLVPRRWLRFAAVGSSVFLFASGLSWLVSLIIGYAHIYPALTCDLLGSILLFYFAVRGNGVLGLIAVPDDIARRLLGWTLFSLITFVVLLNRGALFVSWVEFAGTWMFCIGPCLALAVGMLVPRRILRRALAGIGVYFAIQGTILVILGFLVDSDGGPKGRTGDLVFAGANYLAALILLICAKLEKGIRCTCRPPSR